MKARVLGPVVILFLLFPSLGMRPARAADWTDWQGKWFKAMVRLKGYCPEDGVLQKNKEKIKAYVHITQWKDIDTDGDPDPFLDYFDVVLWTQDEGGGWSETPVELYYVAGEPEYFTAEFSLGGDFWGTASLIIKGRERKGVLTTGTIKTIGSIFFEVNYCAQALIISGKMIKESKVPID